MLYNLYMCVKNQQFAYAKTKAQTSFAETAKLISDFVFAARIVHQIRNFKLLACFCHCTGLYVSDLVTAWADPEGGQGVRTPPPPPPRNCQIISFCHVEIFRQTPSGNLDPPPPSEKIFWIRANRWFSHAQAHRYI